MADFNLSMGQNVSLKQTQKLAPQMRQSLGMLEKTALELSHELRVIVSENPAFELLDGGSEVAESQMDPRGEDEFDDRPEDYSGDESRDESALPASEREMDFTPGGLPADDALAENGGLRDYFIGDVEDGVPFNRDAEKAREFMFARQTKDKTLQDHLLEQIPLMDIPSEDQELARILVGEIDDDGRFRGSIPDIRQVTGCTEEKLRGILRAISALDPAGCGTTSLRECLMAQMDKLDDSPWEDEIRRIIDRHLPALGAGRVEEICADLRVTPAELEKIKSEIAAHLDPRPGRKYDGASPEYVNPEVFVAKQDGRYVARVDTRRVPTLRLSRTFEELLQRRDLSAEDRAYVREKINAANEVLEALERRPETIRRIAQEICDAQTAYLDGGLMRPLTMLSVAKSVGVDESTVSRAVKDKYMSTPRGTIEMRRFFSSGGVTTADGAMSREEVKKRVKAIVDAEDLAAPLSDDEIVERLARGGVNIARRTVSLYRKELGIPGSSARRIRA